MEGSKISTRNVTFVSTTQEDSSIKVKVRLPDYSMKFVHLPPLHRLKQAHPVLIPLRHAKDHIIVYDEGLNEPRLVEVDGVDLTLLWDFLETKMMLSSQLEEDLLPPVQLKFSLYQLGTCYDINDIRALIGLHNNISSDIAYKLLSELHSHFFGEICTASSCVTVTNRICDASCGQKICSALCQKGHQCLKKTQ